MIQEIKIVYMHLKMIMEKSKMLVLSIITSCILMLSFSSYAGVGQDLERVFQQFEGGVNYTKGGAYNTQSGGYYSGGSLYARVPGRNYQISNFQPPNIKAGCGGIDIFAGALSVIDAKQLVAAMRNIMGNATGYAFNLALQEYVPVVYNTMQKLNDIARDINDMNINSCELGAQMVGSVWGKTDQSSKLLCQSMGTSGGAFADWAKARQDCGVGGKRSEINADKKDTHKDQLGDEFNIAWESIKKHMQMPGDKELAELMMSISGTVTGKKNGSGENEKIVTTYYESLINNESLLDMFLYGEAKGGGEAKIYSCGNDYDKCLNPRSASFKVDKNHALVPKIEKMLRDMADKMRNHQGALSEREKSLIELTQIPILRIIAVQNAFMVGNSVMNVNEFSDSIAYDYLLGYLEKQLNFVSINLSNLEKVQMNTTHIEDFKRSIANVRKIISEKRFGAYQRMLAVINVIERSNLVEKKLQTMFTNYNELKS